MEMKFIKDKGEMLMKHPLAFTASILFTISLSFWLGLLSLGAYSFEQIVIQGAVFFIGGLITINLIFYDFGKADQSNTVPEAP